MEEERSGLMICEDLDLYSTHLWETALQAGLRVMANRPSWNAKPYVHSIVQVSPACLCSGPGVWILDEPQTLAVLL